MNISAKLKVSASKSATSPSCNPLAVIIMKRHLYILLVIIASSLCGQNLVPNPSFESIIACPMNQGYSCPYTNLGSFDKVDFWKNPTCTTPEIHHSCTGSNFIGVPTNVGGTQWPRTGLAYAAILETNWYSEYVCSPLSSPLIPGANYLVSFYISCGNSNDFHITTGFNGIGAYLSSGFPDTTGSSISLRLTSPAQVVNTYTNVIKDTINWLLITDTILASGGEDYITIGNFTPQPNVQGNGAYFYLDDVSVELLNNSVSIDELLEEKKIKITPNPATDKINITTVLDIEEVKIISTYGIDATDKIKANYADRKNVSMDITSLDNGVYFTIIKYKRGKTITNKFVKK